MQTILSLDLKTKYPESIFGSLIIRDVPNIGKHEVLEERKRFLENRIRESFKEVDADIMIQNFSTYFQGWGKTYPIKYQIDTIKKGGKFPKVSVLVDSMFLAELNNRILTSGHDLDEIQGDLTFDVSTGGERYLKINGQEQELKKDDILLKDEEGILASILYGPARRTTISPKTKNALYHAWCPFSLDDKIVLAHLNEISNNFDGIFESVTSETQLFRP
ncbi:MAG: phenylalanine--tRNA ligase beta subunit-related protein [Candidatus Thorarchaeota archaeon]|jgi:DNA/RNA-binding domain of Phe-tRNA-synthetase-like protein